MSIANAAAAPAEDGQAVYLDGRRLLLAAVVVLVLAGWWYNYHVP